MHSQAGFKPETFGVPLLEFEVVPCPLWMLLNSLSLWFVLITIFYAVHRNSNFFTNHGTIQGRLAWDKVGTFLLLTIILAVKTKVSIGRNESC